MACNSDIPEVAVAEVPSLGFMLTVTRTATHPFLARYNLSMKATAADGCSATSELFPDTGGVSRRNVYAGGTGRLYVIGQYDVRVFDKDRCSVELREFRSLEDRLDYLGTFDLDRERRWKFVPATARPEQPFEKL
ncbi:hypothetical protein [Nitrospira japonica]|uniref:hypothetical protein n=1 Tax=Nitrospira japonica TaxID=1325564 RepID=UPI0012DE0FE6|nr:hypothetical protein [Nitrospira japonica]